MGTGLREVIAAELDAARRRSLDLLDPLDEADLIRQHSPLMSPLVWDLAHVGNYEDLWLLRALEADGVGAEYDQIYDAFRHPRKDRPGLPLLGPAAARGYIGEVRQRALDVLGKVALDERSPLLDGGFVYGMVVQHEHQHDETMLATLQLMESSAYYPIDAPVGVPVRPAPGAAEVLVEGGPFTMGTSTEPWAYDNERPAHTVDLPAFWIDTAPVTNGQYRAFVEDGGYAVPRWWTEAGWAWRQEAGLEAPQFWSRDTGGSWTRRRFGWHEAVPDDEPVQHVCWYEASAFARWAGKRLPTEAEWEKAASWDPAASSKRRFPWGDAEPVGQANLGQRHLRPAPAGAFPGGTSVYGCLSMVGDVWEWTASDFEPYPGFASFPYREYSEVFYGPAYKVLRGGSWATHPRAVRTTFRNWDYPIRRQIFAGFRCARDAG
ncbi:MAG TPA: ergothioneine biosynthesis protein EgtB [Acidimicrobiales bacterium]|nr:ergothioneine biosynthesis protein EgtB [Acidimicrobiales bacterium]